MPQICRRRHSESSCATLVETSLWAGTKSRRLECSAGLCGTAGAVTAGTASGISLGHQCRKCRRLARRRRQETAPQGAREDQSHSRRPGPRAPPLLPAVIGGNLGRHQGGGEAPLLLTTREVLDSSFSSFQCCGAPPTGCASAV